MAFSHSSANSSQLTNEVGGDRTVSTHLSIVKHCFFDMAVADIVRAIRGRSLMGAFTLSMCAIDAMAYLRNALPNRGTRLNFIKWAEDWIVPVNEDCRADVLYALRCGLVHTSGYAGAMQACGLQGFRYVNNKPSEHWTQPQPNTYVVNLDTHVAEVIVAAFAFFDELSSMCAVDPGVAQDVQGRTAKLASVQLHYQSPVGDSRRPEFFIPVILPQKSYAEMDPVLAPLDEDAELQVAAIQAEIQRIYSRSSGKGDSGCGGVVGGAEEVEDG